MVSTSKSHPRESRTGKEDKWRNIETERNKEERKERRRWRDRGKDGRKGTENEVERNKNVERKKKK